MAEASDNLKAVMARHPEIKKLAEQKEAMRQALIAKGISEESLDDFSKYADILGAFSFSIDSTIEANNYTYNFGTEDEPVTLSNMYADFIDYNRCLSDIEIYTSGNFKNDNNILYLTEKPLASNMDYFCYEANNLLYIPQFDFSNVTSLQYAFTNNSNCLLDEYILDLKLCNKLAYSQFGFTKKVIFKNMSDSCSLTGLFLNNTKTTSVIGINFTALTTMVKLLFTGATNLTHIEQDDNSVILCANALSGKTEAPSSEDTLFDNFDTETLYGFCIHAYDWENNPRNYTKIDNYIVDNSLCSNYYDFHFSDSVKTRLSAGYPEVDFSSIMAAKGWTY